MAGSLSALFTVISTAQISGEFALSPAHASARSKGPGPHDLIESRGMDQRTGWTVDFSIRLRQARTPRETSAGERSNHGSRAKTNASRCSSFEGC